MRGTRIPVHVILDNLAAGESEATILAEYSSLTRAHIRAVLDEPLGGQAVNQKSDPAAGYQ